MTDTIRVVSCIAAVAGALAGCGTSASPAGDDCPAPPAPRNGGEAVYASADVDGVDAVDCDLVGTAVDLDGASLHVPEPGGGVRGSGNGTDSTGSVSLETSEDGIISVSIES